MTGKERAKFRAMANTIEPVFQIGKGGISDALIQQTEDALKARELIKISVLETSPVEAKEAAEELAEVLGAEADGEAAFQPDTSVLRMADTEGKARIFVQADYNGKHIEFRRIKRTNELVVNGMVYAEYEALAESAHTLTAVIGGQRFEAVYDGFTNVMIFVDGQEIARATRII